MIDRYSREEIKKIWDISVKFDYYLKVELAVCEAYCKLGTIPEKALNEILLLIFLEWIAFSYLLTKIYFQIFFPL